MTFRRGEVGRTVALATGMLAVSLLVGYAPATTGPAGEARVPPPIADTSLVFDGVVVIDVAQGKLVPDQRVVISGNRITAIGNTTAFKLPKDARVVDARGKYLIPGLWDMHTHATHGKRMDQPFFSLFIANGVTGIRDASSDLSLDTLRQIRQEVLGGTRVGPPRQHPPGRTAGTDA